MEIEIRYEKDMNRSAAYDGEKRIGLCEYEIEDGKWVITHTETDPAYGGRGIAKKLVMCVKEAADAADVTIIPVCSYAVKVLS
ncbi:MAG: N-acetyltransferase [Stomatobaculum sp.]|nr:N-acetyltransferase [Stomatobaculum sp.]